MVYHLLIYKISKEIEFISNFCADKDLLSITPDDVIHQYWTKIFSLAGQVNCSDEEKDIIYEELAIAYDMNLMLLGMNRRELNEGA